MKSHASLGLGLALALTVPVHAQEPDSTVQFGGFGTLGAAVSDSRQVAYPRDTSAYSGVVDTPSFTQDSRLGLQGHLKLARTFGATLQVVSKYRYNATYMPDITKAELVWNPAPGTQIHMGRMNFESQIDMNVGYDYLWVRPPQEVYSSLAVGALDGVDVGQWLPLGGKALLFVKAYYGTAAGRVAIWRVGDMDFNGGREFGLVTGVVDGPWRIGLSGGQITFPSEFPASLGQLPALFAASAVGFQDPRLAQTGSQFSIKGAVERGWGTVVTYADDKLQVEGQFTRTYTNRWLLQPVDSGCLYGGYKLGKVEPYVMWARSYASALQVPYVGAIPLVSPDFVPGLARFLQGLNRDQHTWSVGERWDFTPTAALKAQFDWVHSAQGSSPMSPEPTGFKGGLKVFTVLVDFKFGKEGTRGFAD